MIFYNSYFVCYSIYSLTVTRIQLWKHFKEGSCPTSPPLKLEHFSLLSLRSNMISWTSYVTEIRKHKLYFSVCQYCFTEILVAVYAELFLCNK